jgi:LysM repeat protein
MEIISKAFHVPAAIIVAENQLEIGFSISPGQKLVIELCKNP